MKTHIFPLKPKKLCTKIVHCKKNIDLAGSECYFLLIKLNMCKSNFSF